MRVDICKISENSKPAPAKPSMDTYILTKRRGSTDGLQHMSDEVKARAFHIKSKGDPCLQRHESSTLLEVYCMQIYHCFSLNMLLFSLTL